MSRRDAGETGQPARHARDRLRATLGEGSPALLEENGRPFEFHGQGTAAGGHRPGDVPAGADPGTAADVPSLRWRLGLRLALAVGALAVAAGAWFWWQAVDGQPDIVPLGSPGPGSSERATLPGSGTALDGGPSAGARPDQPDRPVQGEPGPGPAGTAVVHVAGAVLVPGVVQLQAGSRVHEAIAAAGGPVPGADLNRLNLALVIQDGQKIHVPREGEPALAGPEAGGGLQGGTDQGSMESAGPDGGSPAGGKVNLNTAGIEELDALPKVGPVLAQRILDWRQEHGSFRSVDELDAVDGVGPKMLEALLPLVTV